MLIAIEICLLAVALAIAHVTPQLGDNWFGRWERRLGNFARRRRLIVLFVGLFALVLRAALLPILPVPEPAIHDEFSHLLLADTLAHGRLANPPHPMWVHFETFHVNFHPTYASMYYPGQGFFLGVGQLLLGHPFWGVWLSVGIMCSAICWMLQGWVPASWAFLGGLLAVMRLAIFSYWANTYFGGAVAAVGGALVLGALPRIMGRQRLGDALLMGLGLALLINTRPYESLFFCFPIVASLFLWMSRKKSPPLLRLLSHVVLPVGLLLVVALSVTGYYFWSVTGSPFRIPYQVNIAAYHLVYFPWEKLQPPAEYHHEVMRQFYQGNPVLGQYRLAHEHPVRTLLLKPVPFLLFYLGPALALSFAGWFAGRRLAGNGHWRCPVGPKSRFLLLVCGATFVGLSLTIYLPPAHYSAPLTAAVYALVVQAMRSLRLWQPESRPIGKFLVRAIPIVCLTMLPLRAAAPLVGISLPPTAVHTWYSADFHNIERARILKNLLNEKGQHLVLVRYSPDHEILEEWVYNRADIDGSNVVWARDMGREKNRELLDYYRGRHIWLLEPDRNPPQLSSYPAEISHVLESTGAGGAR